MVCFELTYNSKVNHYSRDNPRFVISEDDYYDINYYVQTRDIDIPLWRNRFADLYCHEVTIQLDELPLFQKEISCLAAANINDSAAVLLQEMYKFIGSALNDGFPVNIYGN